MWPEFHARAANIERRKPQAVASRTTAHLGRNGTFARAAPWGATRTSTARIIANWRAGEGARLGKATSATPRSGRRARSSAGSPGGRRRGGSRARMPTQPPPAPQRSAVAGRAASRAARRSSACPGSRKYSSGSELGLPKLCGLKTASTILYVALGPQPALAANAATPACQPTPEAAFTSVVQSRPRAQAGQPSLAPQQLPPPMWCRAGRTTSSTLGQRGSSRRAHRASEYPK
mmetsp:Transcript_22879/g.64340  ORF Transcript_22879/g.64340 Transcript_22879/m.64340 type:complete len:233 (-) Transcript_22879:657-1355(-)